MSEIFKLGDLDNEQFYMLPKGLFTHPQYKDLTNTARIVYAILKDRMKLSLKNGWHDENDEVYINFTQEKMALLLNITPRAVKQTMSLLKKAALISTKKQGLGLPNKIYIHKLLPLPISGEINFPSEVKKTSPARGNEFPPNDTDISETENNDTNMGAKPHKKRTRFKPPTLEEVEAYVAEKNYSFDAKKFMEHYEASDWHLGNGKKARYWKQCCATWENNAKRYGARQSVQSKVNGILEEALAMEE